MRVPGITNSYDRMRNPGPVLRRHQVEGEPWMKVKVRLERAQGTRRVWIHLVGGQSDHVTKVGHSGLTSSRTPSQVSFESYLDPFGHDKHGREKYRLRRRLAAPVNPHDFEVNRRRNQTPYPHEDSIEVHLDASDEKEVRTPQMKKRRLMDARFSPYGGCARSLASSRTYNQGMTQRTTASRRYSTTESAQFVLSMSVPLSSCISPSSLADPSTFSK